MTDGYTSLVFEGGGVRGIAYVGIIRKLYEKDIMKNIKNVGGSSAGSQTAALIALGFTLTEIEEIMIELPLESFKDNSCGCIRDICRFFNEFGYNKGEFMDNYFEDIIKQKTGIKKATFKDLYGRTKIHLKITGNTGLAAFHWVNAMSDIIIYHFCSGVTDQPLDQDLKAHDNFHVTVSSLLKMPHFSQNSTPYLTSCDPMSYISQDS